MNGREQALRKRNKKLELQNAALKLTLDRVIDDLEFTESMGAAFAMEVQLFGVETALKNWEAAVHVADTVEEATHERVVPGEATGDE